MRCWMRRDARVAMLPHESIAGLQSHNPASNGEGVEHTFGAGCGGMHEWALPPAAALLASSERGHETCSFQLAPGWRPQRLLLLWPLLWPQLQQVLLPPQAVSHLLSSVRFPLLPMLLMLWPSSRCREPLEWLYLLASRPVVTGVEPRKFQLRQQQRWQQARHTWHPMWMTLLFEAAQLMVVLIVALSPWSQRLSQGF